MRRTFGFDPVGIPAVAPAMTDQPAGLRRALVTGWSGFLGRHVVIQLLKSGWEVHGVSRRGIHGELPGLASAEQVDLADPRAVNDSFARVRPHHVFHLALDRSIADLPTLAAHNLRLTGNVLEAAVESHARGCVVAGSAAEYGLIDHDGLPVNEEAALRPLSAYGVMKVAEVTLARRFGLAGLIPVVVGRLFNIVGPGEPTSLVCSALAAQVAAVALGQQSTPIRTGDLRPERDFVDVRDAAQAFVALALRGRSGNVYNICSSRGVPIGAIAQELCRLAGIGGYPIVSAADPGAVMRSIGDNRRIRAEIGWAPSILLERSLSDLLEEWSSRLGDGGGSGADPFTDRAARRE